MPTLDADALRVHCYEVLIATGRAPTSDAIGAHFGVPAHEVRDALRALRIGKTLMPHPETGEIWMAGPFSAVPTSYRVQGRRATWFANCAWDMLGIPIIAGEPAEIDTQCTDCGAPMRLAVDPASGPRSLTEAIVHFLVPARRWYDDIGFT